MKEFLPVVTTQNIQLKGKSLGFEHKLEQNVYSPYEENTFQWCPDSCDTEGHEFQLEQIVAHNTEGNCMVPDEKFDNIQSSSHTNANHEGQSHHTVGENVPTFPVVREINTQERETAISRYKEKKKTRRYDKHISISTEMIGNSGDKILMLAVVDNVHGIGHVPSVDNIDYLRIHGSVSLIYCAYAFFTDVQILAGQPQLDCGCSHVWGYASTDMHHRKAETAKHSDNSLSDMHHRKAKMDQKLIMLESEDIVTEMLFFYLELLMYGSTDAPLLDRTMVLFTLSPVLLTS
nr:zinc finger protein CONSTANS-LIKE 13 [Tanacetum cinerariifolium]